MPAAQLLHHTISVVAMVQLHGCFLIDVFRWHDHGGILTALGVNARVLMPVIGSKRACFHRDAISDCMIHSRCFFWDTPNTSYMHRPGYFEICLQLLAFSLTLIAPALAIMAATMQYLQDMLTWRHGTNLCLK